MSKHSWFSWAPCIFALQSFLETPLKFQILALQIKDMTKTKTTTNYRKLRLSPMQSQEQQKQSIRPNPPN